MIYLLLAIIYPVYSLTGYDCGGQHLNVTTISLLSAGECDLDVKTTNTTETYIQLIQLSDYNHAEVLQCKVEVIRAVFHCGMHSHVSIFKNGLANYIEEITRERCIEMQKDGIIRMSDAKISGLLPNSTNIRTVTLAGEVNMDGKCRGDHYNDPYGTYDNAVVQAAVKITLRSSYVPVHVNTGKIHLKSGTVCNLADEKCFDPDHGNSFWSSTPTSSCDFHQYDVLYEGKANKIQDGTQKAKSPIVYSITTQDITFALMTMKQIPFCGYVLQQTEHPKLFIVEIKKGDPIKIQKGIPIDNLDIFTYVNSKFVYVEKHIRNQMTSLYYDVVKQHCELEKEVLKNILSLATLLPDEFAYRITKQPGHMAVTAGEAIHIIKCIPVEVKFRGTKECYAELPVTNRNASLFLIPKSRILTKYGTQKECSHELPTMYLFDNTWIEFTPHPVERHTPPQLLQPMTTIKWKYITPGPLANSGIYSQQDIEKLRDHIMFSAEKPALLNSVARGIQGYNKGPNTISIHNLLDEETLEKIAQSTASRIWDGFILFGSATAGVFGIFVIIRIIKLIIDTAIHGYALHMVYGCSIHLIGAIWSSLTHLLLQLAHGPLRRDAETMTTESRQHQRNNETIIHLQPPYSDPTVAPFTPTEQKHANDLKELHIRMKNLEQIPSTSAGPCSKNRREV